MRMLVYSSRLRVRLLRDRCAVRLRFVFVGRELGLEREGGI